MWEKKGVTACGPHAETWVYTRTLVSKSELSGWESMNSVIKL